MRLSAQPAAAAAAADHVTEEVCFYLAIILSANKTKLGFITTKNLSI